MLDNECNILLNMSKPDFREFRSLMIEMVLHTGESLLPRPKETDVFEQKTLILVFSDMSMHFSQLKHMKNLVQTAASGR